MKVIDLRSDTVTKPSKAMLTSMLKASLGDDVFGEDPTINQLELMLADKTGMEAAIFAPTGTQSNLMGLMAHCERGDEYIVGQTAHTYMWEGGGAAVLGSIQPQPLDCNKDGSLPLDKVAKSIKAIDIHHPRTKLLCLENTSAGKVLPLNYLNEVNAFCKKHELKSHLDGARAYNAAIKLGVDLKDISTKFDSISICLSKGLGAPVGSVLCGSSELISKARRWRKVLGGGMRQAGILAAAGIYALEHNIARLKEDHENANFFATSLVELDEIEIDLEDVQTNMVFIRVKKNYSDLQKHLYSKGILVPQKPRNTGLVRLVTHLDIEREDILSVLKEIKFYFSK
ncbi:MAG: low-specificity L-threonine aldolase [Tatlockia sp.]|nr:low-specificity L-threonine aldolase [Tatlockia sp.]